MHSDNPHSPKTGTPKQSLPPPTHPVHEALAKAETCLRHGDLEAGCLLLEELLLTYPDCEPAKRLLIEFKLVPEWKLREWNLKDAYHIFVDENIQVFEGEEARKRLQDKNDAPYLSANGIVQVPLTRWEEAQRYERKTWMEQNLGAVDDRNLIHAHSFEDFQALKGRRFEDVIELGCGPFTNLRVLLPMLQGEPRVDLLDPLINDYTQHPHCAYRTGQLAGRPVRLFASPIEQFQPDKQYDLVVMINVLEHCYDIPLIFQQVARMLKPGGTFVFADSAADENSVRSQQAYDAGHPIRMTNDYLRAILQKHFKPAFWKSFREVSNLSHRDISHYFIGALLGAAQGGARTPAELWQAATESKRAGDDQHCLEALEQLIHAAPQMDAAKRMKQAVLSCPGAAWTYTQAQDELIQMGYEFHTNFIALENLTRRFGLKTGVELGVLSGNHSRHLLEACPDLRLYCVDAYRSLRPGNGYDDVSNAEWEKRYQAAKSALDIFGRATMVRATTAEALELIRPPVDFVFIDADHSYESVCEDIFNWYPRIRIGGVLSGHDYGNASWPGVERAVRELLPLYGLSPQPDHGFVWWAQKTEDSVKLMARTTEQLPPDQAIGFLLKQLNGGTDHWSIRLALAKAYLRHGLPSQAREFLKSFPAPDEVVRLEIESLQKQIHPPKNYLLPAIGNLPFQSECPRPADWVFATAACAQYFPQLVNLIGSIHRQAISHLSKIVVYDLGLTAEQDAFLSQLAGVTLKKVPPFCPHALSWWTWKLWAIKDCAENETSGSFLYCDSGAQLQKDPAPLFDLIAQSGHALWHAGGHLSKDWTTADVYRRVGLAKQSDQSPQLLATLQGYAARGRAKLELIDAGFKIAADERLLRPSTDCIDNRHDQSLLSLLIAAKQIPLLEPQPLIAWENDADLPKSQAVIWLCRARGIGAHDSYLLRKSAVPTPAPCAAGCAPSPVSNSVLALPRVISSENSLRGEFLRDLAERFGIRAFVETGTYLGGTAEAASEIFAAVHTIELSPELAQQASARLAARKNVRVYQGDSSELLPQILKQLSGPALFWLDGHWSTGRTARGKVNTPILEELRAIKESGLTDAVILIDDIRLFGKPTQPVDSSSSLHGYPDLNELHRAVLAIDSSYQFLVLGDVALACPASAQLTPSPVIMALTLSRLYDGNNLSLDEIFEAENVLSHADCEERELIRLLSSQRADVEQCGLGLHYRFWHALILMNEKKFLEAGKQFVTAARLGFNHWRLQWYLAQALVGAGHPDIALEVLDQVLGLAPGFSPAALLRKQLRDSKPGPAANAHQNGQFSFSNNWFEAHEAYWRNLVMPWAAQRGPLNILEVGSFEGRSTCWLLIHLMASPQSTLTCVDLWRAGTGNVECKADMEPVYDTFQRNIAATGKAGQVRVLRGHSHELLKTLPENSFDLIYVDGDHSAAGVFGDSLEAFRVLKAGGLLLWDDYYWCPSVQEGVDKACAKLNIQVNRLGNNASYKKPEVPVPARPNKPKIVGLVVGRNEAPRLSFCLRALAKYTDAIVYLDDCSEDKSLELVHSLASECRVERILRKERWHLDEPGDRNLLLNAGRKLGGTHFIAIDADEAFTSNCAESDFLRRLVLSLLPGDQIAVNWIQLWRDVRQYRCDGSVWTWNYKGVIFCDDGKCNHSSDFVHTPRVPGNLSGQTYRLPGYVHGLMHFQFVNWRNLLVKQAWYRCLERVRDAGKAASAINERYAPSKDEKGLALRPAPAEWLNGYPFFDVAAFNEPEGWREKQVRQWFTQFGRKHFKDLDIWDLDWSGARVPDLPNCRFPVTATEDPAAKATAFVEEAERLQHQGNLVAARDELAKAFDHTPTLVDLVMAVGDMSLQAGQAQAARWEFVKATAINPGHVPAWIKLAAAAVALGRIEEFETSLGRAMQIDPKNPEALKLLGDLELKQGLFAEAARCYQQILEQTPGNIDVLLGLGFCLYNSGELEAARLVLQQVLKLEPAHALAAENLAAVNRQLPQTTPATASQTPAVLQPVTSVHTEPPPLVSAIVSTYASERFIRGCLEDLVAQTLFDRGQLEIVVVDTGSPQNERAIVEEFQGRYPGIKYLRTEQRETIYAAWNRGIEAARGNYVTNANTDDRHRPDALEVMAAHLDKHPEIALVYADQLISDVPNETFADIQASFRWNWPDYSYAELERRCIVGSQPMWRRRLHEKHGLFLPELHSAGDYEFWLRIGKSEAFHRLPDILGFYYRNPSGVELSAGHSARETREVRERYGILARNVADCDSVPTAVSREELDRLPCRTQSGLSLPAPLPRTAGFDPAKPNFANTPVSPSRPSRAYQPMDLTARPAVTIVTPFFNTGDLFEETVQSVLRQTFQQWEWLIVNDASTTTESERILTRYRHADPRIKVIDQPANCGPGAARNRGVQMAAGDYIVLLDSDDLLEPTAIEKWLWILETHPEHSFVKGFSVGFGAKSYLWANGFHNREGFLQENLVDLTSMIRKNVFSRVGGYEEQMRHGFEDWEFWLRCASQGLWGTTIPEFLDWYRRRDNHNDRWSNWDGGARQQAARADLQKKYHRLQNEFPSPKPAPVRPGAELSLASPAENRLQKTNPRVLLIMPWMTMGGADKFNLDLVGQLIARGWEVSCVTTLQGDHSWMPEFSRLTPDVFALPHFLEISDYPRFLSYLINSRQVDTVLISNSMMGYQLLPFLRSRFPEVAFLDYCHMEQSDWLDGGYPRISVNLASYLDLSVVSSSHLKSWMVKRSGDPKQIEVCYTNIDAKAWEPNPAIRQRVRSELELPEGHPVILYAGRVVEQKQPRVFAETMRLLRTRHGDFTALVAGDGSDLPWLKEFVAQHQLGKNVRLLGGVSNQRIRELMMGSDIFFLPSQWEGIALSIFEAMACGLAVVGADVGGQRELVTSGCGQLLPRADAVSEAKAYASALAALTVDPKQARAVGQSARARVTQGFRLDQMGDRMVALFGQARQHLAARTTPPIPAKAGLTTAAQVVEMSRIPRFIDAAVEFANQRDCLPALELLQHVRSLARHGHNNALEHAMDAEISRVQNLAKVQPSLQPAASSGSKFIDSSRHAAAASPLVSVVIPCYNYAHLLPEAVESVVKQTFRDFEIIIVNDGSTDNTVEVANRLIEQHGARQRMRLVSQANSGQPAAARNAGIAAATGKYILPLDADDKIAPSFLEKTVAVLQAAPEVGVAYTHIQHFGSVQSVYTTGAFDPAVLARDNVLPYCSLYRRRLWEEAGGYRPMGYEDWDFWLSLAERGCQGRLIPEPLFWYRKHGQGMLNQDNQKRERLVATLVLSHPKLYDESARRCASDVLARHAATVPAKHHEENRNSAPVMTGQTPLRITYLITSILGVTGGNQTLLRQAEDMRRRGHDVTIVTYTTRPDWFHFGVRVVQVPAGQAMAPSVPPSDVVIATYFINALELKAVKAPVKVYYAQGDQFIFADATMADTPQNRQFRALSRASYLLPGIQFVPNSRNLASAVEKLCGRQPDAILPVCTDQTTFRPLQRSLPGSKFRLLIVGPDSRGTDVEPLLFKGIQDTLDALQILAKRYPHFTAVRMSGTSPDIFAKFPCEFYVAPDDGTKTALFGTSHILIYASHYDSCPRPPQEAMAAGCAVVCTSTTGAREYCRDGENSLLVPVQSPAAIADAVERLIHDHALREKLVQGGLATAREFPREREWNEWEAMLLHFVQDAADKNGQAVKQKSALVKSSVSISPPRATAITLPPCALVGHLGQARALQGQKKLRAAWESTLTAIKSRPYHPEAYLLLAQIAQAAGDATSSRRCAQHARLLAPDWKPAKRFLKSNLRGNAKHEWLVLPDSLASRSTPLAARLSVCLIVKDEEKFLGQCLASVRGIATQIVVVDTGSTDRTVAIAKEHGAEVYDFAWCDDFSAARNAALEHATGDWVLMLDADEELPPASHDALRKLLAVPSVMAWRLPIIDVDRENEGCCYVPRLFRNAPALFYVGRVHEQVFTSIEVRREEWGLDNRLGDAALRHHGYLPEIVKDRNKIERNLLLLEKAIVELPDEPNLLMNYGLELTRSGQRETGIEHYRKAFDLMSAQPPSLVIPETREMLLTQFCTQLTALRRFEEIIGVLTSPFAKSGGLTASLHFGLGLAHLELKQSREAADQMRQCLAKRGQPSLAPINPEIRKAGPHHCLALCLAALGETDAAAAEFCLAIEDDPQSRPARFDYARLLAARDQSVEALNLLFELAKQKADDSAVWVLGGQIALSRPEFLEVALDWTADAGRHLPQDLAILRQRAEVLTLANRCAEALPLWRQLRPETDPAVAAALVLCETAANDDQFSPPLHLEAQISREFLKWYQRLIQFNGRPTIEAVNARMDSLQSRLPSVTHVLREALAQASVAAAA